MAQPTPDGLTFGATLLGDLVGGRFAQGVLACYATGDGSLNFVMPDAGLPVQPASGATFAVTGTVAATSAGAGKTLRTAAFALNATGTVVAAVTGKRIKVYAVKLVVDAALAVNWRSGSGTDLEGAQALAANGVVTEAVDPPAFLFATAAGQTLDLVITGTGTAAGRVSYWDDDDG